MPYLLHNGCGQLFYEVLLVFLQVTSFILLVLHENGYLLLLKSQKNSLSTEMVQIGKWVKCPHWHGGKKSQVLTSHVTFELQHASWVQDHETHTQLFSYTTRSSLLLYVFFCTCLFLYHYPNKEKHNCSI